MHLVQNRWGCLSDKDFPSSYLQVLSQIQWFLNGKQLKTGSRVKTISDFGFVVLEISPTYPEDSGEYTCRAINKVTVSFRYYFFVSVL